jgi:hypothetical protein
MATLKNTNIDDTGFIRLPIGTTAQRPGSPVAGMTRFNTSLSVIEFYNGSSWVTGIGGSPETAATSGNEIFNAYPSAPTGVYWLRSSAGVTYQAFIKMDQGGGWINVNTSLGPYSPALTTSNGSGGGNMTSGARSGFSRNFTSITGDFVLQNQAEVFGCPGFGARSIVNLNSTLRSDINATQVRINFTVTSLSNTTCGFHQIGTGALTIVSGTANNFSVCNNPPNRYDQVNPGTFTAEGISASMNSNGAEIYHAYTACSGRMSVRLNSIFVR